jgi:hypothetical protein
MDESRTLASCIKSAYCCSVDFRTDGDFMAKVPSENKKLEFEPDAWPRFERFIKQIAKAGPQHRVAKKKKATAKKSKREK